MDPGGPEVSPAPAGRGSVARAGFGGLSTHHLSLVPTEHIWDVEACGVLGSCSCGSVCITQHATAGDRVLPPGVMADLGQPRGRIPGATALSFGHDTLCQSPAHPCVSCVPVFLALATQAGEAQRELLAPFSCVV